MQDTKLHQQLDAEDKTVASAPAAFHDKKMALQSLYRLECAGRAARRSVAYR